MDNAYSPDETFALEENRVAGRINGKDAVAQAVYLMLNTERYEHVIYSQSYGFESADLFGKPMSYVLPELERRIVDTLMQDDRIAKVDGFQFDTTRGAVRCWFTVHSRFGNLDGEKRVYV